MRRRNGKWYILIFVYNLVVYEINKKTGFCKKKNTYF